MINRRFVLTSRPTGLVSSDNFRFEQVPVPAIKDGEVLVRNQYLSLDPTHRIWMSDMEQYMEPIAIGDTVRAFGVGVVVESKNPQFKKDDLVSGLLNWQDYAVGTAASLQKLPPLDISPTAFLSVLGLTGVTAYFGYLDITHPKAGETLVVSGAAGAVGSIVGQIAKIKGQRVVGIAGSDEKCQWLTKDLGFDGTINYRKDKVSAAVKTLCPKGVDIYFDNVGGAISEAVWGNMNLFGRVSVCGLISGYNEGKPMLGPKNFSLILMKRLKVQGFIVTDYAARWSEAVHALYGWVKEGKIKYAEDIEEGLENAPKVLNKLFDGSNTGKLILKVS
ncbi:MAG: hypothetical protein RL011_1915 [Pseudomonadota bacterium]